MGLSSEPAASLSPIKRALLAVEDMQAKLDTLEYARREPIAIIGMGCRFPGGVNNPQVFWQQLQDGVDAITEVPPDRWDIETYYNPNPDAPGKTYARKGGFLTQVDGFDPQFFGISAREATSLDPQQRLLLEVSWEALESANRAPDQLLNTSTGVFIGICANDYNRVVWPEGDLTHTDAFSATGNALSVAAGRLSYTLGLKGPSLAVDTACSSSLVAVHLACQHLRHRECDLALTGGVHLLLTPETTIAFSKTRMLAPDGRCRTFDAAANGYVRGEGCGVIVLKRLSDAQADGDNILAVIRGSAVNHKGRSSSLIAPNGPSQQAVIRQALKNGNVEPTQVGYVEVQGTGTALGEPIEVEALGAVFGKNRPQDQPIAIGSVKTNIGHLEAASGVASLIKVVLALQHGEVPPHLHYEQPNPHINWDQLPVKVPTEQMPWTVKGRRLAGVSAFSFSGTNAHIVLEEAIVSESMSMPAVTERPLHLLTLSAKTEQSLVRLAKQYETYLVANPDLPLGDICFTANTGRSHFQHRLSVVASSSIELGEKLATFSAGNEAAGLFQEKATTPPKVSFLFAGQNGNPGMAGLLYETQLTFRQTLDRCEEILRPYLQQSLLEIFGSQNLNETTHGQLALFALEYALFQVWKSWGIEPAVVIGDGVGEYVAACVAGVFSLEDGLKLVAERGHLTQVSPQEAETELEQIAKDIIYSQPQIPFVSNLTGELTTAEVATPGYWCRQIRQSVRFAVSMETLRSLGCDVFLELGSKSGLEEMGRQLPKVEGVWLSTLNQTQGDWQQLLQSLGMLYVRGANVNWSRFDRDYLRHYVQLPTYPWQHDRYWVESAKNGHRQVGRDQSQNGSQDSAQTGVVKLLSQGDAQQLTQHLAATGKLSEEELQLLPKLIEQLVNQHQQELRFKAEPALLQRTDPLTADDIQTWMIGQISQELGVKSDEIDIRVPFDSYGLDSMLAIGIASAGQKFLGLEMSPLLLVHYPTIELLSKHLATEFAASGAEVFEI